MNINHTDIENLEERLRLEETKLEERKRAILIVKEMLDEMRFESYRKRIPNHNQTLQLSDSNKEIKLSVFANLAKSVEDFVDHFDGDEFIVADVEKSLLQKEISLPNNPRTRIATVIQRLVEKRKIVCTFQGGGCVPKRYRKLKWTGLSRSEFAQAVSNV